MRVQMLISKTEQKSLQEMLGEISVMVRSDCVDCENRMLLSSCFFFLFAVIGHDQVFVQDFYDGVDQLVEMVNVRLKNSLPLKQVENINRLVVDLLDYFNSLQVKNFVDSQQC